MAKKIKPDQNVAAPIGNDVVAPPDFFRIAAFGDSLMWGQGLNRNETFVALIAAALEKHHGKRVSVSVNRSRSGAQIMARADPDDRSDQREGFLDRFPALFPDATARAMFRSGEDEGRANDLYGEIPAAFPTIEWQVEAVDETLGARIDVVLLSGGANDIAFDAVINPQKAPGKFIQEWDEIIRRIAHDDVLTLIKKARAKCPNAVIMYFGYFAPISNGSHVSKIRAFFKHEADDDFGWALNRAFNFVDVEGKIREARARSLWAQGRAQHWMRSAVTDANADAAVRGPGVLFIPSGIRSVNAVFADSPMLHEDFTHPATDAAQAERTQKCPRLQQLADMRRVAVFFLLGSNITKAELRPLRDALAAEGPVSVVEDLTTHIDTGDKRSAARDGLTKEIHFIQRALIASFLHPNAAGASRYADIAMQRYRTHTKLTSDIQKASKPGAPPKTPSTSEALDDKLRRYKVRGSGSLLADVGHLDVDSLSLHVVTARNSDAHLAPDVSLIIETSAGAGAVEKREYLLNFPYHIMKLPIRILVKLHPHFEPDGADHFTIDTVNQLRLDEIVGVNLALGKDPLSGEKQKHGSIWRPRHVDMEINGRRVIDLNFENTEVRPMGKLDLSYPPPAPIHSEPEVALA